MEAENTAISTLAAIMGRTSAYTGKEVTWEEMMNSELTLGPAMQELGLQKRYTMVDKPIVPVAGTDKN